MTETTPLLPVRYGINFHISYPVNILSFFTCILLNFLPLIPIDDSKVTTNFMVIFIPDLLHPFFWRSFPLLLDDASHIALEGTENRRPVRKSDSLNSVLEHIVSGVLSIGITVALVLGGTGFSNWIAFLLAFIILTVMALIPFTVFVPLAKVTQRRKAERDDALEKGSYDANHKQSNYTASFKTYTAIRTYWCMCLLFGFILFICLTAERKNIAAYGRLLFKIKSMDKTFDKIVQSVPKAKRITDTMRARGGIIRHLSQASKRTWKVNSMALGEVEEFQAVRLRIATFLQGLSIIRKGVKSTTLESKDLEVGYQGK